jgi:glycosyltransferase involved in cell wall biosynthesis
MKVLYVDLEREWRGGQSQALLTLCGLREASRDALLLAAANSPLAERAKAKGLTVRTAHRFGLRAWAAVEIQKMLCAAEFDVVHLNEPHALTAAWLARAHRRLPLLLSRRIGFPLRKGWVSRARYASVTRFIANSEQVAGSLRACGIAAERISVVNEGVEIPGPLSAQQRSDSRESWSLREEDFVFGCASVFVREKGQRHLVDAMSTVIRRYPNARLLLAGDGPCLSDVQSQVKKLGLSGSVIFAGFVSDMARYYAALNTFVFPSEFEGLGTALQSAMAYGIPVISTARGALGEVVSDERTALVAEPEGQAFAAAMIRLIQDDALRARLAGAGRLEVEQRFSAVRMATNTVSVYEDVLRNWRRPS